MVPPHFGFAPPVLRDATKHVTMDYITLLCRSKRLRVRNASRFLTLKRFDRHKKEIFLMCDEIFTFKVS